MVLQHVFCCELGGRVLRHARKVGMQFLVSWVNNTRGEKGMGVLFD